MSGEALIMTETITPDYRLGGPERLESLVERLAERLAQELTESAAELRATAQRIRETEAQTRWLNTVSATLKNRVSELELVAKSLEDEAAGVTKKMLGTGAEPIHTRVDTDLAAKVMAAKDEDQ